MEETRAIRSLKTKQRFGLFFVQTFGVWFIWDSDLRTLLHSLEERKP